MTGSIAAARAELAPTGTLRVALNMGNFLLTATDPATGAPRGLAAALGRELGQRLGVPVTLLPYPNPGALADAASTNVWDVGIPRRRAAMRQCARLHPGLRGERGHLSGAARLATPDHRRGGLSGHPQAAGTPTGRPAGIRYLRAFIEDIKALFLH